MSQLFVGVIANAIIDEIYLIKVDISLTLIHSKTVLL